MRAKTVSVSLLSATLLLGMTVTGLTGCGTKKAENGNVTTKSVRYNTNGVQRYGTNSINNDHLNERLSTRSNNTMGNLRYSKELSDKVGKLKQVGSAKVMLTGHKAYVAASIKDHNTLNGTSLNLNNTGTVRGTGINNMSNDGNMMGVGAPTTTGAGSNVRNQTGGIYPANKDHGYGTVGTSSYGLMRGLTTTPATGTGNNVVDEDKYMTQEVKDMIADVIKKNDSTITEVFVSANPEFVERVGNFVTDVSNGHPISGIVDEFQTLVDRIFPTASGNNVINNKSLNMTR